MKPVSEVIADQIRPLVNIVGDWNMWVWGGLAIGVLAISYVAIRVMCRTQSYDEYNR